MFKRIMFGGFLLVVASCGDSKDVDKNTGDGGNSKSSPSTSGGGSGGSSSSSSGGSSGSSSSNTSSGDGGPGSSAGGSSSSSGGSGGSSSTPGSGTPADGTQLAQCSANDDCNDGLNCYVFGRYCSAACATDADCASLGAGYTCNARMTTGGGGFPGGGGQMGADAAAPTPTGTCRLQCTGTSDTSCPSGMSCVSAGGFTGGGGFPGGMGADAGTATMGTFRCQYPMEAPMARDAGTMGGEMMGGGMAAAFEQCSDDSDCADGLNCTAGRTSSGYCTESCDMAADCTMMPGSGTAMPTCSAGGNCTLSCAAMGTMCPTGMTCVRAGGPGGGGTAFCNFMSTNMMPGGGFPGGGG